MQAESKGLAGWSLHPPPPPGTASSYLSRPVLPQLPNLLLRFELIFLLRAKPLRLRDLFLNSYNKNVLEELHLVRSILNVSESPNVAEVGTAPFNSKGQFT